MQVKPILFQPDMVRAILDGRKTQTRRVLNPQPEFGDFECFYTTPFDGKTHMKFIHYGGTRRCWTNHAPYVVGDLLWVRENILRFDKGSCDQHAWYRADGEYPHDEGPAGGKPYNVVSIHMPRWANRLTLDVQAVKVERIQYISEEDAKAEGVEPVGEFPAGTMRYRDYSGTMSGLSSARRSFRTLWNSINAKPTPNYATIDGKKQIVSYTSYPWEEGVRTEEHRGKPHHIYGNPWVIAPDFKPHLTNIDEFLRQREAA